GGDHQAARPNRGEGRAVERRRCDAQDAAQGASHGRAREEAAHGTHVRERNAARDRAAGARPSVQREAAEPPGPAAAPDPPAEHGLVAASILPPRANARRITIARGTVAAFALRRILRYP